MSAARLRFLQWQKLRRLLRFAYDRVPFYRQRFDECGIKPEEIQAVENLERFPTLDKETLRRTIAASREIPANSEWVSTSGSTGIPLRVPFRPQENSRLNLTWLRPMIANGIPLRVNILEITGPHNFMVKPPWYHYFGFLRKTQISVLAPEVEWLQSINRIRPDLIWGYSGSIRLLAQWIENKGGLKHRPRWVVGVSDLIDAEGRKRVERVFAARFIDLYGAAETGCIAWYCRTCREYHVNIDHLVVEFLPISNYPSGFPCKICVTNLHSYPFPVIRYEIGDLGIPSEKLPLCGLGLPLMKIVEGRSDAVIRLSSGRLLSPMFFFGVMKKIGNLENWQVIQERLDLLRVKLVPADPSTFDRTAVERILRETIGEPVQFAFEVCRSIPLPASGKPRAVYSQIAHE